MKNRFSLLFIVLLSYTHTSFSQGDLLGLIQQEQKDTSEVSLTFKGTRIGIGHSVETRKKGTFELAFGQRYWNTPEETSDSFIIDQVCTTFGLDYSFTDDFTVGTAFATLFSVGNLHAKYKIINQKLNTGSPISITFVQTLTYDFDERESFALGNSFTERSSHISQLLIARKFSQNFSFQIAPTFISRGSTRYKEDPSNHFAIGFSTRYKVNPHVELFSEYYYLTNPLESIETFDAFTIGANWEIKNFLLSFQFTNARPFAEDLFITSNRNQFNIRNEQLTFGFRSVYTFQL